MVGDRRRGDIRTYREHKIPGSKSAKEERSKFHTFLPD